MEFYCDARMGARPNYGYLGKMNRKSSFIVAQSKTITQIVPLSSLDAETYTSCIILYIHMIFKILGKTINKPTVIYCDNQPTVDMCCDVTKPNVSRYFIHWLKFIKKAIAKSDIEVLHIAGQDNWADNITRAFGATEFEKLSKEMFPNS